MSASTLPVAEGQLDQLIDRLSQLPIYSIGRKADNAIVVPDGKVSGQHARLIQCTDRSFVLEDLDSKNGTFVNGTRITRKVIDRQDAVQLADTVYTIAQLLDLQRTEPTEPTTPESPKPLVTQPPQPGKNPLDFTEPFADLHRVFEQYPQLRRNCRNREKMIRTGSVILSSVVGISAVLSTGGGALLLPVMSGAGLSMLVPTLCSVLLSTDEKLEIIDKEYRERYRCPNPICRDPFGTREWDLLAQQKTCRRCQAIWVE